MEQKNIPVPTVVVIDDEPLIRWALSQGLAEAGYPVRAVATAAEARCTLDELAAVPCVVLLDLRLPDVADLSLLAEIRTRWPAVPVVVMTAHGSVEDAAEAKTLGAFDFVSKPFDVAQMIRVVTDAWAAEKHPTG